MKNYPSCITSVAYANRLNRCLLSLRCKSKRGYHWHKFKRSNSSGTQHLRCTGYACSFDSTSNEKTVQILTARRAACVWHELDHCLRVLDHHRRRRGACWLRKACSWCWIMSLEQPIFRLYKFMIYILTRGKDDKC